MEPPYCTICGQLDFAESEAVYFKRTPEDEAWYRNIAATGETGHPPNAAWFCVQHKVKARELKQRTLAEACELLK